MCKNVQGTHDYKRKNICCRKRTNLYHFIVYVLNGLSVLFWVYIIFSFNLCFLPSFLEGKNIILNLCPRVNTSLLVYFKRSESPCVLPTLNYLTITLQEKHQTHQNEFNSQTRRNSNLTRSSLLVCKHSVVPPVEVRVELAHIKAPILNFIFKKEHKQHEK